MEKSSDNMQCLPVFATAQLLYCHGYCGEDWLDDVSGCQQADADAFCKLKLCDEHANATDYEVTTSTYDTPGFACDFSRREHKNMEEFELVYEGTLFGITDIYFTNSSGHTHGTKGDVVSNVICQTSGKYNCCLDPINNYYFMKNCDYAWIY